MTILSEAKDRILRIEINRPEKKNALTIAMYSAMAEALEGATNDAGIRVVVIHGQPDVFSSGNDLLDFMQAPRDADFESLPVYRFMRALSGLPKPAVAAVRGPAVGIGTTLLLHCDLVYCGESAMFQMPFVNLALVPEFASSLLLPATAGYQRAAELLMLGDKFGAAKAREAGIVNEVVGDDAVLDRALAAAAALAEKPPQALAITKSLLKKATSDLVSARMIEEGHHFHGRLTSPEALEAFSAFFQRRKPDFSRF